MSVHDPTELGDQGPPVELPPSPVHATPPSPLLRSGGRRASQPESLVARGPELRRGSKARISEARQRLPTSQPHPMSVHDPSELELGDQGPPRELPPSTIHALPPTPLLPPGRRRASQHESFVTRGPDLRRSPDSRISEASRRLSISQPLHTRDTFELPDHGSPEEQTNETDTQNQTGNEKESLERRRDGRLNRKRKISLDPESLDEEDDPSWEMKKCRSKVPKISTEKKKSRQSLVGEKTRKKNLEIIKTELKNTQLEKGQMAKELNETHLQMKEEKLRRETAELKLANYEEKERESKSRNESWLKLVYKDLSSSAAREFKLSVFNNRNNFEPGFMSRLRKESGINFSQVSLPKVLNQTEREKAIKEFALLNSSEIPDMKANHSEINGNKKPNKRYAMHYLNVLQDQFDIDYPEFKCSYSTFAHLWPSYIIKPRPGDFSSCHCTTCENNNLLMSALIKNKLVDESQDVFAGIKMSREGNNEILEGLATTLKDAQKGSRKEEIITYVQWETVTSEISADESDFNKENGRKRKAKKEPRKRMKSIKIKNLVQVCLDSFNGLKEHLDRSQIMKTTIATKKEEVLSDISEKSALVWIDWSEGLVLRQDHEIQSAWFGAKTLSLQSGYIFRRNNSQGFGSFAEGTDHKAEAIWASMRPLLEDLLADGVIRFYFVSDSPVNQYRCNKNIYFLSEWCLRKRVNAIWLFTETSHGKSSADGIGGSLKTTIRELMSFHTDTPINSISDLMSLLQGNTRNKVTYFTKDDVGREKSSLPSTMKPLKGALQIHQIQVSANGEIGAKKLPTDPSYSRVNLAPS